MKTGFSLVSRKNALWVRILRSKYGLRNQLPDSIHKNQCSHLWRSLSKSTLRDWVLLDGSWNIDLLRIWLPDDVIECIVSIPLLILLVVRIGSFGIDLVQGIFLSVVLTVL
ncbi:hypothetical protein Gogos_010223 [Gossypium gossypioides]|uniref:Uncharacterized protein n=1 Tax=Gossypium gossypioides TaxID=34282 RepID=A0A7J9BKP9_GOSGO|nr:hypothetical protein [Gossypium gossypioides]